MKTETSAIAHQVLDKMLLMRNPNVTSIGLRYIRALIQIDSIAEEFEKFLGDPNRAQKINQPTPVPKDW